jgi:hypothetical protein
MASLLIIKPTPKTVSTPRRHTLWFELTGTSLGSEFWNVYFKGCNSTEAFEKVKEFRKQIVSFMAYFEATCSKDKDSEKLSDKGEEMSQKLAGILNKCGAMGKGPLTDE